MDHLSRPWSRRRYSCSRPAASFDRACLSLLSRRHVFTLWWIRRALSGSRCHGAFLASFRRWRSKTRDISIVNSSISHFYWQSNEDSDRTNRDPLSSKVIYTIGGFCLNFRMIYDDLIGEEKIRCVYNFF